MSSKTKKHLSTKSHAMSAATPDAETNGAGPLHYQKIRIRAYEIYLERGEQHGRDLDDWLQAEHELTTNHNVE